ncbi:TPA: oligosaccharide flippase family protein [Providencia alcalifaciens]|nr:oligosaccharide flippase family protein [Providencia alcalifaciens]
MSKLKNNIFSLLILQGSNYIIPLITLPYLTRTLGIQGFGIYGLTLTIAQYFILFTDFGFNFTATKKIAENQNNKNYISRVFWITIFAKSILCIISVITILSLTQLKPLKIFTNELIFTSLMIIGTTIMPLWFFQGIEKLSKITIVTVTSKVLTLPLFFILIKNYNDVWLAVLIQSSINLLSGFIAIYIIWKGKLVNYQTPRLKEIICSLHDSSGIFLASISISIYTISTSIIIGLVSKIDQVSIFTGGDRLKSAILGVFLILGNAFYPRIINLLSNNKNDAFTLIRKIIIFQSIITLLIGITSFILAKYIAVTIYGESFSDVAIIITIFSPLYFFVTLSTVFGNYILLPLGYKKEYISLPILSAIIHIPLCTILAYNYGALGGALSILIVELISCFLLMCILVKKNLFIPLFYVKANLKNEK